MWLTDNLLMDEMVGGRRREMETVGGREERRKRRRRERWKSLVVREEIDGVRKR